jgi:hypothetical protein
LHLTFCECRFVLYIGKRFRFAQQDSRLLEFRGDPVETTAYQLTFTASVTAISQSCEVSARYAAS